MLAWALLTRRWAAAAVGAAVLGLLAVAATLVAGIGAWSDFLLLMGRVSDPDHHAAQLHARRGRVPGWACQRDVASLIQWAVDGDRRPPLCSPRLRRPAAASYLVVVVATQLLSPILWDHYALLLLLPVAWLLDRGRTWAVLIPLATCVVLVGVIPPVVYPLAFAVTLVALLAEGSKPRRADRLALVDELPIM